MLLIEWDERWVGTCKMTNADISGNRKGNKAQRHCQIGKFNDSEIISNRELVGMTRSWEAQNANLQLVSSVIKVRVSKRTGEQAKWAPTLKGRRLWCHHCPWFGHWGG